MRVTRLRKADRHCFILVLLHWGWEHHLRAVPRQREEAHRLIDAGADAIVGHHSHTLQTVETYRGKPVYYGIGNFIFDQHRPLNTRACLVKLSITADRCKATPLPIEIRNCVPCLIKKPRPSAKTTILPDASRAYTWQIHAESGLKNF